MKTKEFVKDIEALGYEVSYSWGMIYIRRTGDAILDLGYTEEWDIDIDYPGFDGMLWDDKKELMSIVSEYMLTDPKDREEEKRCLLRYDVPPLLRPGRTKPQYLNIRQTDGYPDISYSFMECSGFQKTFTESEIAQMDITGFVKVEVPEC